MTLYLNFGEAVFVDGSLDQAVSFAVKQVFTFDRLLFAPMKIDTKASTKEDEPVLSEKGTKGVLMFNSYNYENIFPEYEFRGPFYRYIEEDKELTEVPAEQVYKEEVKEDE